MFDRIIGGQEEISAAYPSLDSVKTLRATTGDPLDSPGDPNHSVVRGSDGFCDTSQIFSSISRIPTCWLAKTWLKLILRLPTQMR